MKKILLCIGCIFAANSIYAQTPAILDSIVIRQNRLELSLSEQNKNVQVLTYKEIQALPVKSTAELLAYISGIDIRQRGTSGTQADISIDGSTFDQVLVLINGVKMSDPQTGHHLLNLPIPLSSIDHVEILRGPAAHVYGVNALAGAINIVTSLPKISEVSAQVYTGTSLQTDTANGDTYFGWGAQATAAIAVNKQTHLLSVAHNEGNGYRHNTSFNAYRIFYQNKIELNAKNSIDAMGGFISNSFGANGYYSAPKDAESVEEVQTATGSIRYNYKPTSKITISPRISYRYNNDDYIFVRSNPVLYHNIHETNVITGEVQSSIATSKGKIGIGAELRNEQINSTNLGKRRRDNIGIYAEYKHNFNDRLNAGAGLYTNYNSDYGWQLFPGIDAGYKINRNWKIFANTSMGQRLPTYTDLYYKGPTNIGNDKLQPELATYAEGGIKFSEKLVSLQASYFYRHTSNFIDWVRTNTTDPWQPRNFQSVNTGGITFNAIYDLGKEMYISIFHSTLNLNYTYLQLDIENPTSETSKYTIDALKHQATASFRNILFDRVHLNITGRYLYRISANDYTIMDIRLGYQWKAWMIYTDLNNMLDTQYKEIGTVPMPGRWCTLGVKFNKAVH